MTVPSAPTDQPFCGSANDRPSKVSSLLETLMDCSAQVTPPSVVIRISGGKEPATHPVVGLTKSTAVKYCALPGRVSSVHVFPPSVDRTMTSPATRLRSSPPTATMVLASMACTANNGRLEGVL